MLTPRQAGAQQAARLARRGGAENHPSSKAAAGGRYKFNGKFEDNGKEPAGRRRYGPHELGAVGIADR